jgi:hypothetical protein
MKKIAAYEKNSDTGLPFYNRRNNDGHELSENTGTG